LDCQSRNKKIRLGLLVCLAIRLHQKTPTPCDSATLLSITLFLKYMGLSRQICSVFDAGPTFGCFQLDCRYTDPACWSSRQDQLEVSREFCLENRVYIGLTSYVELWVLRKYFVVQNLSWCCLPSGSSIEQCYSTRYTVYPSVYRI